MLVLYVFVLVGLSTVWCEDDPPTRFRVTYEWNLINFTWTSEEDYQTALKTSRYIPENVHISGIKTYGDYIYLTVPRMKSGVPVTLTRIRVDSSNTAPLLEPFPSWSANAGGNCSALQNVQNVEIDSSGMLWILDGGHTETLSRNPNLNCPPRLLIVDLRDPAGDLTAVVNYTFSESINNSSFLYDLVVDDVDGGYAYITDNSGVDPAIIVYSRKLNRSWRIRDRTMFATPEASEFTVNGTAVSAMINIASIALGPRITNMNSDHHFISQDRTVYYCPLSSYHLYGINSAVLRDESSSSSGIRNQVVDFGRKASQTDGMVMDENGILYYGLLGDNSIAKWDSVNSPFTSGQQVIGRDRIYIQWPDSLAFDQNGNLLVVTNRLQKFIFGKIDLNESNYRILEAHVGAQSYLYHKPSVVNSGNNNNNTFQYNTQVQETSTSTQKSTTQSSYIYQTTIPSSTIPTTITNNVLLLITSAILINLSRFTK